MYFLFDVGGTHTRIGFSRDGTTLEGDSTIIQTPRRYEDGIALLVDGAKKYAALGQIQITAGGLPGVIDQIQGTLVRAPHLEGWAGKPFVADLSAALGTKVLVENDAALAGLGEAIHGAGKSNTIVAYLTISTGVGGVRIVNGAIDAHRIGFEPGHQIIAHHDQSYITLESLVSGSGIERRLGKKPEDIVDPAVWQEVTAKFAIGVANTILLWAPDIVVIGGALKDRLSLTTLEQHIGQIISVLPTFPKITLASLKSAGGLYGALEIARGEASKEIN
ncbi:MAG: ROK family protein [Candidatus Ryanbacteria bacterium]|nr:ROK family protein [Candidatus Ryanbacteria bacterium]